MLEIQIKREKNASNRRNNTNRKRKQIIVNMHIFAPVSLSFVVVVGAAFV